MALIKLDPIVDKISGKVGGQSFVAGTNGNYIRNNAQTRKGTLNQGYQSKTKTPGVNATWQKLTNAEKQTFIDLVGTYPYINRINEIQQYSAYQIFMLCAQGAQLINESIKFSGSAFVVINKPSIVVLVNNPASMMIEITNPQSGIYYAIYATSPQNVGVYSVRRNLRYLGFVTEATAANPFNISTIYDNKFNAIIKGRNYGVQVKPIVLNSGQIGPASQIEVTNLPLVPPIIPHYLKFDPTWNDFLSLTSPASITFPQLFEVKFKILLLINNDFLGLMSGLNNTTPRTIIRGSAPFVGIDTSGNGLSTNATFAFPINTIIDFSFKRNASNTILASCPQLALADVPIITSRATQPNTNPITQLMRQWDARYFNGYLYEVNLDGIIYPLNEGSGNVVTSTTGQTMTIETSNPAGITYINSTMWNLVP